MADNFGEIKALLEAPVFKPNEKEFLNGPIDYIEKIKPSAENFGICRIIPPPVSFNFVHCFKCLFFFSLSLTVISMFFCN